MIPLSAFQTKVGTVRRTVRVRSSTDAAASAMRPYQLKIDMNCFFTRSALFAIGLLGALTLQAQKPKDEFFKIRNGDTRIAAIKEATPRADRKASTPNNDLSLWYRQPASQWVEALPRRQRAPRRHGLRGRES
jgi:hypothetical protein